MTFTIGQKHTKLAHFKSLLMASTMLFAYGGISQAQEAKTITLSPIVVEGDKAVVTEGSTSFVASRVTVGGKQPQDRRDIPQTVVVVPRQLLDDISANSIEDASKIIPSLTNATGDGFIGSLYSRGQEVFQYFVDGAPRPFLSIYGTAPDLFFFDRLEILSGPSGVYQGSGEPVGTLNLVRKRPTEEHKYQVGVSGSTLGEYRIQADAGGPVNENGSIRARIAAFGEHKETDVKVAKKDTYGVFGTVEMDIAPHTTLAVGGIYEHAKSVRNSGLPTLTTGALLDVSRRTFIGSPDNNADIPNAEAFAELEHVFNYGGVLKATARVFNQEASLRNLLSSVPVDPTTGNFGVFWFAREFEQTSTYGDINLTSPVTFGSIPTEIVVGADYRHNKQDFKQNFDFSPGAANINTFDPNSFPLVPITFPGVGPGFRLNTITKVDELGLYAQGRFELTDRLKVSIGGRFSHYESDTRDTGRNTTAKFSETNFAPYAGVTFDVLENVTAYASYAEIFQPQSQTDVTGSNLKPRVGSQYEVGIKTEHLNGALTTQFSYYKIKDTNRAANDPANVGFSIASGDAETEGFEMLVRGSPYTGWDISAGYALVSTDLTNDPTPKHNFSAFAKYTFNSGMLEGLSLGAGVRAAGKFDNLDGTVNIKAPGYVVADAVVSYKITQNLTAQLNVDNIFDNDYVERINTTTRGTFYGKPLTAKFALTYSN